MELEVSEVGTVVQLVNWKLGFLEPEKGETEPSGREEQWQQFQDRTDIDVKEILPRITNKISNYLYSSLQQDYPDLEIDKKLKLKYKRHLDNKLELLEVSFLDTIFYQTIKKCYHANSERKEVIDKLIAEEFTNSSEAQAVPVPIIPKWDHLPIEGDLDKHDEAFSNTQEAGQGLRLIGARVRGKKHKHDGTNCDDWYEYAVEGPWTIIAVSDGAGSKKLSRVGAKVACHTSVKYLSEKLSGHRLRERAQWAVEDFKRNPENGYFDEKDIEFVQTAIHEAIVEANVGMEKAAKVRAFGEQAEEYKAYVGDREVVAEDLSCTLLLVVQSVVKYKDNDYSFIMTCQVGDGMTAAIDQSNRLQILGIPDSGEFSGETDFLTSKKIFKRDYLVRKTFPYFSPLQALMVMTDGVADDYFPADPAMKRLFSDLHANRILGALSSEEGAAEEASRDVNLQHWLDTYYVRGSFDDRTMVVLYKEEQS